MAIWRLRKSFSFRRDIEFEITLFVSMALDVIRRIVAWSAGTHPEGDLLLATRISNLIASNSQRAVFGEVYAG